ncbi:ABC transporter ATP-binding protein [Candidatus Shapirobacteria bacterium]|nr:ABC transporter ATP-binding protein [Candidatus Shapirobacteria bacterium]
MSKKNPLMSLAKIAKHYYLDEVVVKALDGVSLDINQGDLVTIVGTSGSGKSTLLHMLGLLDRPSSGKIVYLGKNTRNLTDEQLARLRNETLGFVFQSFNLLSRTSALDNVLLPVWYHDSLTFPQAKKRAGKLFAEFGMSQRADHFSNQLSGGEQQRVAIMRSLLTDPKIIFADEPTGNLDSKTGREIINILLDLNQKQGKTLVLVTHDLDLAKLGKKRIYLKDGKILKMEEGR